MGPKKAAFDSRAVGLTDCPRRHVLSIGPATANGGDCDNGGGGDDDSGTLATGGDGGDGQTVKGAKSW